MIKTKSFLPFILKNFIRPAVMVLVAVAIILFSRAKILGVAKALEQKKQAAFLLESRTATTEKLREDFRRIGNMDQKILASLPLSTDIRDFTALLESLAAKYSMPLSLQISEPVLLPDTRDDDIEKIATVDYIMTLRGNVNTFLPFLKEFEKTPYLTSISSITVTAPEVQGWEDISTFTLQARLYTLFNL